MAALDAGARKGRWIRPPLFRAEDVRAEEGTHRQATWLELFFDLVFVAAMAGLVSLLREELSWVRLGWFAFLFLPTWWLWTDFSYYADQFDSDDVVYRIALLGVMFGVLLISRTAPQIAGEDLSWGALVFGAMYAVLAALYARAWRPNPELRPLVRRYVIASALGAVLFASSIALPPSWRYISWGLTVIILMANSPLAYYRYPDLPSQVSHMPERFGLFMIIALGESVIAVSDALEGAPQTAATVLLGLAGFVLAASVWWLFFIRADHSVISAALQGGRRELLLSHVYGYSHYFVYVGVVAAGIGVEEAILAHGGRHALGGEATAVARAALAGGVAVALIGMLLVHVSSAESLPHRNRIVRGAAAAACLALAAVPLGLVATLLAVSALVLALAVAETIWLPHPSTLPDEAV